MPFAPYAVCNKHVPAAHEATQRIGIMEERGDTRATRWLRTSILREYQTACECRRPDGIVEIFQGTNSFHGWTSPPPHNAIIPWNCQARVCKDNEKRGGP